MSERAPPDLVDVLIVGGGPAGQACAVTVARNQHTTIVFDSQSYRNERVQHFHMVPTWDGKNPLDFHRAAIQNTLDNFETIFFVDSEIKSAKKGDDEIFEVVDSSGKTWRGKGLVLATGIVDVPLDIPGFDECWGRSIYHCLFCHGYEERGNESSGILAIDDFSPVPATLHVARNAAQLTKNVTIYTNGDTASAAGFEAGVGPVAPFKIDSRRITKFELGNNQHGITIHFDDGTSKQEAFIAHKPKSALKSSSLAEQLGLQMTPQGDLLVSQPFGETSVGGCFAAGDNSSFLKTTPNALHTGANSAAGVTSHVQSRKYGHQSLGEFLKQMASQKKA
ncbi:FAD/NAD(P)-binding domain-containing protein [Xylariaceae sp. FL0255]|nr:FAD/NAD(P)-binding domain-containing protein [Xylariaceae sp. FL0255]